MTPIAFARSPGSVKSVMTSESAATATRAPPNPWIARAPTRNSCEDAVPQASEASVKSASPMRNILRWP